MAEKTDLVSRIEAAVEQARMMFTPEELAEIDLNSEVLLDYLRAKIRVYSLPMCSAPPDSGKEKPHCSGCDYAVDAWETYHYFGYYCGLLGFNRGGVIARETADHARMLMCPKRTKREEDTDG